MRKIYYCYDALCGWCYGFSPVITAFASQHPDLPVRVVSGGMITGGRIGPIGEVAGYIGQAYRVVEDRCGVTFGAGFLDGVLKPGTAVFTSVPAAVAMAVFRELLPDRQLDFAASLQRAVYYDGSEPLDLDAYADRAATFGLDRTDFRKRLDAPHYQQLAQEDFEQTARWGVSGFPTVVYDDGSGKLYALARGYVPLDQLEQTYQMAMASV